MGDKFQTIQRKRIKKKVEFERGFNRNLNSNQSTGAWEKMSVHIGTLPIDTIVNTLIFTSLVDSSPGSFHE
jgi:hypothetical protein